MPIYKVGKMEDKRNDQQNAFSEYMWMEDLEKFDQEMTTKIAEEDYIRSSIEMLLEEEERSETIYFDDAGHEYMQNVPEQFYDETNASAIYPPQNFTNMNMMGLPQMENLSFNHAQPQQPYLQDPIPTAIYNGHQHLYPQQNQYQNSNLNPMADYNPPPSNTNRIITSNLNPNATPFSLNPEAKEFVPKSSTQR